MCLTKTRNDSSCVVACVRILVAGSSLSCMCSGTMEHSSFPQSISDPDRGDGGRCLVYGGARCCFPGSSQSWVSTGPCTRLGKALHAAVYSVRTSAQALLLRTAKLQFPQMHEARSLEMAAAEGHPRPFPAPDFLTFLLCSFPCDRQPPSPSIHSNVYGPDSCVAWTNCGLFGFGVST